MANSARRYPFVWLLTAICIGIILADRVAIPPWVCLMAALLMALAALVLRPSSLTSLLLLLAIGGLAGARLGLATGLAGGRSLRAAVTSPQVATVYGRVSDWPDLRRDRTEIKIAVDSLATPAIFPVVGEVLLKLNEATTRVQLGDYLVFGTRLYPLVPEQAKDAREYRRYLRLHGIQAVAYLPTLLTVQVGKRSTLGLYAAVDGIRSFVSETFQSSLSEDGAGLANGFLLGDTRLIDPAIFRMFRDSGTLHVMAVSGSNVALLLLFLNILLRPLRLTRRTRYAVLLIALPLYTLICFAEPSVIRASIMVALVLIARLLGRKIDLNHVIAVAAGLILLHSPAQLFDIGFQLSFATAWGLVFAVPRILAPFGRHQRQWWYRWLLLPVAVAFVAQLFSMPLILYHFEQLAILSLPANLLVVPLVSLATVLLLLLPIAALITPLLARFLGALVDPVLRLVVAILDFLGGQSMPVVNPPTPYSADLAALGMAAVYSLLILSVMAVASRRSRRMLVFATVVAACLSSGYGAVTSGRSEKPAMYCQRLPGGVLTAIFADAGHGSQGRADLILTSLADADYDLNERVLMPAVRAAGIQTVASLVILDCDYRACDDILGFARLVRPDRLLIAPQLEAQFQERILILADSVDHSPVAIGFPPAKPPPTTGFWLTSGGLCYRLPGARIDISPTIESARHLRREYGAGTVLVIGSPWYPSPPDWVSYVEDGYTTIIAASIRGLDADGTADPEPIALPAFLHSLEHQGPIRRDLPETLQ